MDPQLPDQNARERTTWLSQVVEGLRYAAYAVVLSCKTRWVDCVVFSEEIDKTFFSGTSQDWAEGIQQLASELAQQLDQLITTGTSHPDPGFGERLRRGRILIGAARSTWDMSFSSGRAKPSRRDRAKHYALESALRDWELAWEKVELCYKRGHTAEAEGAALDMLGPVMDFGKKLQACVGGL